MAYNLKQGEKYNRLTVIEYDHTNAHGERVWKCKCDCGNITFVPSYALVKGHTRSCGCLVSEKSREASLKHGLTRTKLQRTYSNMITRCYNPNYKYYHAYGGRGISVCDEWRGKNGLQNFAEWARLNGYEESLTLDRIDVNGNYCHANCRWATMKQQQNNRTNNARYEYNGEVKTMSEWAEYFDIKYAHLQHFLWRRKMPFCEAVKAIRG